MQYKWKLSYWVLMVSSCLVQPTSASDWCDVVPPESDVRYRQYDCKVKKTGELIHVQETEEGMIIIKPYDKLTYFGGYYGVDNALIIIDDGKILKDSILAGGNVANISHEESDIPNNEKNSPGKSVNVIVKDEGKLYVNKGGMSKNTVIDRGGSELVEATGGLQGVSKNATVKKDGWQIIDQGGKSEGAQIYGGKQVILGEGLVGDKDTSSSAYDTVIYSDGETLGEQKVYDGGIAQNTKIMNGGVQEVAKVGPKEIKGGFVQNTEVFGGGKQYVSAGGSAESVTLNETAMQAIYSGGFVKDLTINNEASSWVYGGATLAGRVEINHNGSIYLYAGNDEHHTKVENVILNGRNATLFSVGTKEDNDFTQIENLSGTGIVQFILSGDNDKHYSQLHVKNLLGNLNFMFNTTIATSRGDYLVVENGQGKHTVSVFDSGVEITQPQSQTHDLITDKSGGADFTLVNLSGAKINAVDGGTYVYGLQKREHENAKIWYLAAKFKPEPEPSPQPSPDPLTTPSTDALLSIGVTPQLIFHTELQTLRADRGILDRTKKNTALWSYVLRGKERLATGHTHFDLDQTGVVLGTDVLRELTSGDLFIGGFGSYDHAHIAHARKGVSNVDVYGAGIYATYFDQEGWYVDSILKYNYYQNNLRAFSTNSEKIEGDYQQSAFGTSFEAGYRFQIEHNSWVQPYGQLTWLQVENKNIRLSNGMIGDIGSATSLQSALGLFIGRDFTIKENTQVTTYIAASWLREYIDNNYVTINKQNKFITDLSGNTGKFGLGLKGSVSDNLTLYAEANYLKGSKRKQSVSGLLGVRYNF
ncbi:hypothetical protein H704_00472 [Bartonella bacilliformis Peru38]|nr:autotransporter outer membrane beta-barrel domain-containing protein [Bartonella bacilliformis]ABM45243.1 putative adhesin/invasin [Bartonella bacilliformis KC583]AMG85659.1 autotransporter outer membrane beta-barrel domain-containing protein [Bartonella bacilliformis]EYS90044.1 hypothetical protein X472_00498 [Bartonella bacilliformis San Pedro600-02]EYS95053.1 hypothetical protein X470_00565 [Bartonella bacilliformis Peru-18]KEG17726.1 hypothetical protein H709_00458 [Bartonella bacillifo